MNPNDAMYRLVKYRFVRLKTYTFRFIRYRCPQQTFCLSPKHVLKTSSRYVFNTSSRHVFKTSSRRLQRNNFSSSKMSSTRL